MRRTVIWTIDVLVYWSVYASLGLNYHTFGWTLSQSQSGRIIANNRFASRCKSSLFNNRSRKGTASPAAVILQITLKQKAVGDRNESHSHYNDVTMSAIASQIISPGIVYSTVYSGADQRKHQSSAGLAFVRRIHRGTVNSPHKRPVMRKMFPFDDVIIGSDETCPFYNHNFQV